MFGKWRHVSVNSIISRQQNNNFQDPLWFVLTLQHIKSHPIGWTWQNCIHQQFFSTHNCTFQVDIDEWIVSKHNSHPKLICFQKFWFWTGDTSCSDTESNVKSKIMHDNTVFGTFEMWKPLVGQTIFLGTCLVFQFLAVGSKPLEKWSKLFTLDMD